MVVSIVIASGGHWAILQSFAWSRMLVKNIHDSPLAAAVEKTFDGQHPCDLCKSIASERAKEKNVPKSSTPEKVVLFFERTDVEVRVSAGADLPEPIVAEWLSKSILPETPPPNGVAA
jgi:hypothetical protein